MGEVATDELSKKDKAALDAIRTLVKYLAVAWISEGCRLHPQWGCASCEAVELERRLEMLRAEIQQNAGIEPHI